MRAAILEYLAALDALHLADSSIDFAERAARLKIAEQQLRVVTS